MLSIAEVQQAQNPVQEAALSHLYSAVAPADPSLPT